MRDGQPGSLAERTRYDRRASHARRVVAIGSAEDMPRALAHPAVIGARFAVVGVVAVDVESDADAPNVDTLRGVMEREKPEILLVAGPVGAGSMRRIADLALLFHCEVLAVMPTEMLAGHDPIIVWSGDSPLVQLTRIPRQRWERRAKRVFDILGSAIGLVIAAPLIALLAVLVRLESRGSPLFRHMRIGFRGRRFGCLKLRTMRTDAEEVLRSDAALYEEYRRNHFKLPEDRDPRVTTLGRFLRRTSLDELPQLWNVLCGDMSLVGPRPVVEEELELYGNSSDLLLSVRPGITGSWAVSGRHDLGYPDRCEIELDYVRRWTITEDVRILFRTISAVRNSAMDPQVS